MKMIALLPMRVRQIQHKQFDYYGLLIEDETAQVENGIDCLVTKSDNHN